MEATHLRDVYANTKLPAMFHITDTMAETGFAFGSQYAKVKPDAWHAMQCTNRFGACK